MKTPPPALPGDYPLVSVPPPDPFADAQALANRVVGNFNPSVKEPWSPDASDDALWLSLQSKFNNPATLLSAPKAPEFSPGNVDAKSFEGFWWGERPDYNSSNFLVNELNKINEVNAVDQPLRWSFSRHGYHFPPRPAEYYVRFPYARYPGKIESDHFGSEDDNPQTIYTEGMPWDTSSDGFSKLSPLQLIQLLRKYSSNPVEGVNLPEKNSSGSTDTTLRDVRLNL